LLEESDVRAAESESIAAGVEQIMVLFVEQIVLSVDLVDHCVRGSVPFSSCSSELEDSVYLSIEYYSEA
jgi:hypothetical protein